mgnify:CR=1 FL=1
MTRWLALIAMLGCVGGALPGETDDHTGTTGPPPDCDHPTFEGSWSGEGTDPHHAFLMDITFLAGSDEGESSGSVRGLFTTVDPNIECTWQLICLGRPQNDWQVFIESYDPGPCTVPGYNFVRLQEDGTLRWESSESEFGDRPSTATLERVD